MVVCHKDRWVNGNSTKLKSTLLPNLFIHILQVLYKTLEYPKRTSHLGFTISEKRRRRVAVQKDTEIPQPSTGSKRGSIPQLFPSFSVICKPQRGVLLGYSAKFIKHL